MEVEEKEPEYEKYREKEQYEVIWVGKQTGQQNGKISNRKPRISCRFYIISLA